MNTRFSKRQFALGLAIWLPVSLLTLFLLTARGGAPRGGVALAAAFKGVAPLGAASLLALDFPRPGLRSRQQAVS